MGPLDQQKTIGELLVGKVVALRAGELFKVAQSVVLDLIAT